MPRVRSNSRVAPRGRQRHARQPIAQRARGDGDVVVIRPERRDQRRRRRDPADSQSRQAVRLRQSARDDHALGPSPHRRRLVTVELGAAVDLVRQHPRAVPVGDARDAVEIAGGEPRAGRVVGLQITIILVRADTRRSSAPRSARQRPAA